MASWIKRQSIAQFVCIVIACVIAFTTAFVVVRVTPPSLHSFGSTPSSLNHESFRFPTSSNHLIIQKQRQQQNKDVSSSSSYIRLNLFGLGLGEIVLITIGIGIVLGPSGIANVVKSAGERVGEIGDELKTVPKEFQKGVEIGEIEARSRKAKPIIVSKEKDDTEK